MSFSGLALGSAYDGRLRICIRLSPAAFEGDARLNLNFQLRARFSLCHFSIDDIGRSNTETVGLS